MECRHGAGRRVSGDDFHRDFYQERTTPMAENEDRHARLIVEQFTRQAAPFAEMPIHSDAEATRLVLETAQISAADDVLDVACGPGLISCAVAEIARRVTGLDLTPAMIEQAEQRQRRLGLSNVAWQIGNAQHLPFAAGSFSVVMTRYSFHHLLEPARVLAEMGRVCRAGGRVAVIDVCMQTAVQGALYDRMEQLRDPSHIRALTWAEFQQRFAAAGLRAVRTACYALPVDLEELLAATRTAANAAEQVRQIVAADMPTDALGIGATRVAGRLRFAFPIAIFVGTKP
jgi:ubiquinone/menaquinone biosynthesis C-methylase UbiE